ncbi:hypothetical protein [Cellulomonas sp.]|uniref:hypothetical protein n=1 Tax=Cellulomonas sp. TaxID=40001 RepID=UPI00258ADD44|nr:hypothetical protein [Cellulomonas sp.]MCR6688304.1 hypothetical protein [Cellulomonas sp.]
MVGAVLRDRKVVSAAGAGAVIALCLVLADGVAWPLVVIAACWLVATVVYVRDAVRAARDARAGQAAGRAASDDDGGDSRR